MDPIQAVHVKLLARDLLALTVRSSNPPYFTRNGRPVARAETVGVVVSRERRDKFLKFLVDDGSGCVPCILWLNHHRSQPAAPAAAAAAAPPPPIPRFLAGRSPSEIELMAEFAAGYEEKVRLGGLVRVRGRITVYRGAVQVTVGDVAAERDPNAEVLHWLDCVRLARSCYDLPPPPSSSSSSSHISGMKRKSCFI